MKVCSIEECGNPKHARSWCTTHYGRWRKFGDPMGDLPRRAYSKTPDDSFDERTEWQGDCLVWTGANGGETGYGKIWVGDRAIGAHRYAWERINGPIPDGMLVDHKCWNRACVKVEHLRLATFAQNNANRSGPAPKSNTGVRGVVRVGDQYRAQVGGRETYRHLGTFRTLAEADEAAASARARLYGEFAGV